MWGGKWVFLFLDKHNYGGRRAGNILLAGGEGGILHGKNSGKQHILGFCICEVCGLRIYSPYKDVYCVMAIWLELHLPVLCTIVPLALASFSTVNVLWRTCNKEGKWYLAGLAGKLMGTIEVWVPEGCRLGLYEVNILGLLMWCCLLSRDRNI